MEILEIGYTPKVSIIVPCYSVENYLDRCITSLVNQTLAEIEIILVDDKSPDNVPEMCDNWLNKDCRIKVVHKKHNEGLGYARNSGMEYATGEYIAFLDSDDYVDVEMYEKLYNIACNNCLQAVFCGFNKVDSHGYVYQTILECDSYKEITTNDECRQIGIELLASPSRTSHKRYIQSVWHGIYNREFLIKNRIKFCSEREFISEDIIFDVDFLAVANHIGYVPHAYNYYCDNFDSLSKVFRKDRFDRCIVMWNELCRRYRTLGYDEIAVECSNKYIVGKARECIYSYVRNIPDTTEAKALIAKIVGQDTLWNKVFNLNVLKILPFSLFLFLIILKLKSVNLAYLYAVLKIKLHN